MEVSVVLIIAGIVLVLYSFFQRKKKGNDKSVKSSIVPMASGAIMVIIGAVFLYLIFAEIVTFPLFS